MKLNNNKIAKKIEDLIKEKIVEYGLVNTGRLLNSIKVNAVNDGFEIIAEDYFTPLDEKYGITDEVLNSSELMKFIEDNLSDEIEKNIE